MTVNMRKHQRVFPKENTYASFRHNLITVGKIKDISLGGLSFTYWANKSLSPKTVYKIKMLSNKFAFYISDVPCKVVYDRDDGSPYLNRPVISPITSKQCGVKFGELTKEQTAQITNFINNNQG